MDLPELGTISRSDYMKNKQKYRQELLENQKVLLNTIKSEDEPTKPAEAASVDQHLDNAALEQMDFDKDETLEETCSSSSLQPASCGDGGKTPTHGQKQKTKKNKNKGKKKVITVKDKNTVSDVDKINVIMLDAYFKRRREFLKKKFVTINAPDQPTYFLFENILITNAEKHSGNLSSFDMEVKNDFCSKVLAELPTMELSGDVKEEHREMLIRFVQLLASRDDDMLLMDIAAMVSTLMSSEHNAAHFLWLYHTLCSQQDITANTSNSNGTPTQETSGSSKPKAKKTQKEEDEDEKAFREAAELNMSLKVDTYYKKRQELRDSKTCPADICIKSQSFELEKTLIINALNHSGDLTEIDVKFKTVVCRTIIGKLPSWGFSAEQQKTLTDFYTLLAGRNDPILLMDALTLNEIVKANRSDTPSFIHTYFGLCTFDILSNPIKN